MNQEILQKTYKILEQKQQIEENYLQIKQKDTNIASLKQQIKDIEQLIMQYKLKPVNFNENIVLYQIYFNGPNLTNSYLPNFDK